MQDTAICLHYCQLLTLHGTVFNGSQILWLRAKINAPVLCLACLVYHVLILTSCVLLGSSRSGTASPRVSVSHIKMLGAWSHEGNLEDCRLSSTFNTLVITKRRFVAMIMIGTCACACI